MLYTDDQKRSFKNTYAMRRKRQIIASSTLIIFVAGYILGKDKEAGTILDIPIEYSIPIFLVIIISGLIFSFKNWRCPACNKYLGKVINPKYCHSCGEELR